MKTRFICLWMALAGISALTAFFAWQNVRMTGRWLQLLSLNGGPADPNPPGDTLRFDGKGAAVSDTGASLNADGVGTVNYVSIETLIAFDKQVQILDNEDTGYSIAPSTDSPDWFGEEWRVRTEGGYQGDFAQALRPYTSSKRTISSSPR